MNRLLDKGGKRLGRVGAQVTTMGHKTQISHKFYFNFDFTKIENLSRKDMEYVLILERRDKLQSSDSFRPDGNGCADLSERLSMDATLFRAEDALEFQNKQVKIAVRFARMNGKTAAKIHLDIGKYAKAPSGEINVKLKMTNGVFVYVRIASSLVKPGNRTSPSSLYSAMTTGSGGLSRTGDTDLDDLDDLELGEDQAFLDSTERPPSEDNEIPDEEKIEMILAGDLPPTPKNVELVWKRNEQLSKTMEVYAEDEEKLITQIEHVREQIEVGFFFATSTTVPEGRKLPVQVLAFAVQSQRRNVSSLDCRWNTDTRCLLISWSI
uniref:C2 NT-type domain-containing protein n=1 Tax=Rhodosorus marinus TaxID=101924 RepID=A0A7S0BDZ2_9RHOD|mmetsp:Transcript_11074/g.15970  ORF Transcript_11074/g.15970 Transcript_11074/m.15970 type:complete len:323 (+) Transcript_11074:288-1256(+)